MTPRGHPNAFSVTRVAGRGRPRPSSRR
jgi:hypothetical protein